MVFFPYSRVFQPSVIFLASNMVLKSGDVTLATIGENQLMQDNLSPFKKRKPTSLLIIIIKFKVQKVYTKTETKRD